MEIKSEFDNKSISPNDNNRNYLIASDASPSKIFNFKIDEVRSPEVRKCKSPTRCTMSSTKMIKKSKIRYSEVNKLNINIVKVEKNNLSAIIAGDKTLGRNINSEKIVKHESLPLFHKIKIRYNDFKSVCDKGISPVVKEKESVSSVKVINDNAPETSKVGLTPAQKRKESVSSVKVINDNAPETSKVGLTPAQKRKESVSSVKVINDNAPETSKGGLTPAQKRKESVSSVKVINDNAPETSKGGLTPAQKRKESVSSVKVINDNAPETSKGGLTPAQKRKESVSSVKVINDNAPETFKVCLTPVKNTDVHLPATPEVFHKTACREITDKGEFCISEVSKYIKPLSNASTSNLVRSISIQNFESPQKFILKCIDTSGDILEKSNEINVDNVENQLKTCESDLLSIYESRLQNTDKKLSMENDMEMILCSPEIFRPKRKRKYHHTGSLVDRCCDIVPELIKKFYCFLMNSNQV
ncbi:hypothetical protein O3M35_004048 [Rhynocoris fuscipes]|uniref:Uncharacterized protein n=1 Tax=Rhynocoris fuscipes TaxID=488301 RepID=A0AAW1CIE8_9HEMI